MGKIAILSYCANPNLNYDQYYRLDEFETLELAQNFYNLSKTKLSSVAIAGRTLSLYTLPDGVFATSITMVDILEQDFIDNVPSFKWNVDKKQG